MQEQYRLTPADRVLQKTPSSFDVSVWEFFWPLLVGASLLLAVPEGHKDPSYLKALIDEGGVTTLHFVPAMLQAFLEPAAGFSECRSLRQVMCSGEALSAELQKQFFERMPQEVRLHNLYGPTEAAVDVTFWECQRHSEGATVPIGSPIANTQMYVLDASLEPVPIGVVGQLYIGGVGLARGYWGRAALTAERFVPHPWSPRAGGRLYQTGDLARYEPDGRLEYRGRGDGQVKLRGYRIELGEIEAGLMEHAAVKQSVVVLQGASVQEKRLVAYVVAQQGSSAQEVSGSALRSYLKSKVPEYMVPAHFVRIDTLPLTPNGKVDRRALPVPDWQEEQAGNDHWQPGPLEELVGQVWQQVLQREQIGSQDDFFEIGGHSLLATQVIARLRDLLSIDISLRTLFEAPTLSGLTARLQQQLLQGQRQDIPAILPISRDQELPLSFAQQRLWFLHQLVPQSAAYTVPLVVHLQGSLDIFALHRSFSALHQRHETLRTTFTERADQVVQHIGKETVISFTLVDLSYCREQYGEEQTRLLVQEALEKPFDLTHGPLLRSCLLRLSEQEHVLLLTMHHIVSDGWSMSILIRELTVLYQSFTMGNPSPLAPLPIQYADYAYWQRQWLQGDVLKEQIRYWTNQLSGARAVELPTDYPRPQVPSQRGARYDFHWDAELMQALGQLSRQEGVTLFMTLLTAFQVLLYRLTGEEDIVVGTDSANRAHLETEGLIGFFVNLQALRTTFHGNPQFLSVLREVREMILGAYAYQELPFEMIAEHLRLERKRNRTPLVNVLFVMQNVPQAEAELSDLALRLVPYEATHAKFDLAFFVTEDTEGLFGSVTYSTDLFKRDTVAILVQRYAVLLRSIVAWPDTKVASLEIATEDEKMQKARQQATLRQNLKMSRGGRQRISGEDGMLPT
jgi:non-ribosomal peptide synthetase component F